MITRGGIDHRAYIHRCRPRRKGARLLLGRECFGCDRSTTEAYHDADQDCPSSHSRFLSQRSPGWAGGWGPRPNQGMDNVTALSGPAGAFAQEVTVLPLKVSQSEDEIRHEMTLEPVSSISEGQIPRRLLRLSSPNARVFGPGLIPRSLLRGDLH